MANSQEIIAGFNNRTERRIDQLFENVNFGSDLHAGFHDSAASFRASDSIDYVSKILTEFPVSFIAENPGEVEAIRDLHGIEAVKVGDANTSAGESYDNQQGQGDAGIQQTESKGLFNFGIVEWLTDNFINMGVGMLALVLILGGLVIIAMQSDTVKTAVKDSAKAAVA